MTMPLFLAIDIAVELGRSLGFGKVVLELDSLFVIQALNSPYVSWGP